MAYWSGWIWATGSLVAPENMMIPHCLFFITDLTGNITQKTLSLVTLPYLTRRVTCILLPVTNWYPHTSLGASYYHSLVVMMLRWRMLLMTASCSLHKCAALSVIKTSCLNACNTSFIPSLSYRMIVTQFTEQQWNKAVAPAICTTYNVAVNFTRAVLYGPLGYQDIGFQNPYLLQEIIHIIALLNKSVCNSSTSKLLHANAEQSFQCWDWNSVSSYLHTLQCNTFASCIPSGWYKSPLYKLDIAEDYGNLPLLYKKGVYIMQTFVDNGFKGVNLKAVNVVHKFLKAVSLADIVTVNGNRIYQQAFEATASNGLCVDIQ